MLSTMISNRQLFFNHVAQTSDMPLAIEIERAEGLYMYTPEGKSIMDLISGIAVSNVGHCHPKVVQAIQEQSAKFMHLMVFGELIHAPQSQLAQAIQQTLPQKLDNVYFVNSGSEAVEGALKLAKRYTGRQELISFKNAYHGSSHGALSMMGNDFFKDAFRPLLPNTKQIRFNHIDDLNEITHNTAAIIIEPIQGEAGVVIGDEAFYKALNDRCQATGTLLIVDEIQSGFGRTGQFWAFEALGLNPDIVLCAKGMGGGMPIGAFISSKEIMSSLTHNPFLGHITTFGGNAVTCAASLATLQLILEEELHLKAKDKGTLFKYLLQHPQIKEVRGKGLMLAVELNDADKVKKVIQHCVEQGILTDWFLFCDTALRIAPPLTIQEEEIKKACKILLHAFNNL
jgi:putrescine aminotransferase